MKQLLSQSAQTSPSSACAYRLAEVSGSLVPPVPVVLCRYLKYAHAADRAQANLLVGLLAFQQLQYPAAAQNLFSLEQQRINHTIEGQKWGRSVTLP